MLPDLWFDVYPYNNPQAGARLVRLTSQQLLAGSLFRVERRGTGSGRIVLNSGQAEFTAANLHEENLVEVGDANVSATDPLGGFFLHRGDLEIISADEQGGEDFPIGGPGLLAYLAREIMWSHTYFSQDIDPSIAFAFGMDPFDDLWRLSNAGTGSTLGAMLWRAVWEGQHFPTGPYTHRHGDGIVYTDTHVDDRPSSAIPDLSMDFDENLDSDGNAWSAYNGAFAARMKQQILAVALELIGKGMDVQMRGGRQLILSAYNSYGRDFRGSAFGAGVVRFAHGVNIANPARRAIEAGLNGSRALVGSNDTYVLVSSPVGYNVVRSIGLDSDAEDPGALAIDGAANLRAREAGSDVPALKVLYGDDPTNGRYLFAPPEVGGHAWVGDLVTIHRGAGPFQWNNADARIEAITFELTDEKVWDDPTIEFGAVYRSADERGRAAAVQAIAGKPHGPHIRLCVPATPASVYTFIGPLDFTSQHTIDSAYVHSGDDKWPTNAGQIIGGEVELGGVFGGDGGGPLLKASPGAVYRWTVTHRSNAGAQAGLFVRFYDSGMSSLGDQDIAVPAPNPAQVFVTDVTAPVGSVAMELGSYAPVALTRTYYDDLSIAIVSGGGSFSPNDGHADLVGTGKRAKRCDDKTHVIRDSAPTVDDDWATQAYRLLTVWHQVDSLVTPTEIIGSWVLVDNSTGAAVWLDIGGGLSEAEVQALIDASVAAHEASADPHTGYVHETDANWVDLTDGGATTLHSHASSAPTGYYRPLMDGYGNVVTDSGTGAAIMAYAED